MKKGGFYGLYNRRILTDGSSEKGRTKKIIKKIIKKNNNNNIFIF